ncbi:MAG: hypothetical protein ACK5P0_00280 [bacterium]|jgi:hypothetical protein
MNLGAVRDDLQSAIILGGISKVYKYMPERPNPLCAIMEPDTEFITVYENQYDADYASNWKVLIIVPYATNETETENLDDTLDTLIPALWEYTSATKLTVDKPFILEVNNARFLATNINISIDIEGGN